MKKIKDLKFGERCEKNAEKHIAKFFNIELIKQKDEFSLYDYTDKNNKYIIEIKGRRCHKNRYKDTLIGYNKIKYFNYCLKKNKKVILIFSFRDDIYYYEFKKIHRDYIRRGGRGDRGLNEYKKYYFIPTDDLLKISCV